MESLIRQSIRRMERRLGSAAVRDFGLEEQQEARDTAIRIIRRLLRKWQTGDSNILAWGSVEFRAGLSGDKTDSRKWQRHDRTDRKKWHRDGRTKSFTPYVALRSTPAASVTAPAVSYPALQEPQSPSYHQYYVPNQDSLIYEPDRHSPRDKDRASSMEILNALSLTNTARNTGSKQWEWTARIEGPPRYLHKISSVTYFLHPSFTPNIHKGDPSLPGHPFTAVGWGVFELKAEVVLNDGTRRTYRHMLRF